MSRIALGLMRIENMDEIEIQHLLEGASKLGIDKLDIADIYGRRKCEELLGNVFFKNPDLREKFYLQTKVGIAFDTIGFDSSYDYIIKATKECIERLHVSYIDCLLIHRPDIFMNNKEVAKAISYLKDNGLIKDFGVSNFSSSEIEYLKKAINFKICYNQVSLGLGNTTMIDQVMYTNMPNKIVSKETDDLFFYLKKEDITIQCWSPYLVGFFQGSIFDEVKEPKLNEILDKYAKKYNTSKCAIATAFLLRLDPKLWVITGSTNLSHIKESIDGENINLTREDWYRIYSETGHLLP